jgi:hypothetical protein
MSDKAPPPRFSDNVGRYNYLSPTLLSVTSCADDVSNNGVALEEEEEDAKELDDNGLRLHPVQHCHPGTNQLLINKFGHNYICSY